VSARVEFQGVWKSFPSWSSEAGPQTTRSVLTRRLPGHQRKGEQRYALSDVSVGVAPGRMLGIVGANGAGKSTMLRLAAGLGRPSRGTIVVPDDTAAVLSLGDVFDLTLSGAENALTAALIGGLSGQQARSQLPAILEFAELEDFAQAPMRTYSDGMKLRLAFGVVAQLQPEALILDEVLAVGDLGFQAKCAARIDELRAGGTTVLFASHSLEEVAERCDEAIWLQYGRVRAAGPADEVVERYREAMKLDTLAITPEGPAEGGMEFGTNRFGSQAVTIDAVRAFASDGLPLRELQPGQGMRVELDVRAQESAKPVVATVAISRLADDVLCLETSSEELGSVPIDVSTDGVRLELGFDRLDLNTGEYSLDVGVYEPGWSYAYDYQWHVHTFRVGGMLGTKGVVVPSSRWHAPVPLASVPRPNSPERAAD
jgi:ABC-type polysaccharide/polyol phosphate transport system ATPase subunit